MEHNQSRASDKGSVLANVALLYYGEGLTQGDIARRMGVSRATIVNMLREARENRIVDIRVDGKHLAGSSLSLDLKEKFGLQDVYIATCSKSKSGRYTKLDRAEMLRQVGRVAAIALTEIIEPGDTLGVAWGETIFAVSEQMAPTRIEGVTVCQMIGSMISDIVPASEQCAIQIANNLSAKCYTLHAPAIGSSPEVTALFKAEPTIQKQLDRLKSLDMVIASIGHVEKDTHMLRSDIVTEKDLEVARAAGAVGVICCRYVDAEGKPVRLAHDERLMAADFSSFANPRKKLLVVGGIKRENAVLAAIRGGFVTHLCVDNLLAEALMKADF